MPGFHQWGASAAASAWSKFGSCGPADAPGSRGDPCAMHVGWVIIPTALPALCR